jgi:hypothetical protein
MRICALVCANVLSSSKFGCAPLQVLGRLSLHRPTAYICNNEDMCGNKISKLVKARDTA